MQVLVEFYGIPRLRAGRASLEISLPAANDQATLGEVLKMLARELPEFADHCLQGDRLRDGYIANVGGRRFLNDPATKISDGDSLLILSADVGG